METDPQPLSTVGGSGAREQNLPKFELGVLFIHGIGQQVRGETLVRLAEALVRWLERWIGGEAAGPVTRLEGRRAEIEPHLAGYSVEVVEARLTADGRGSEPATAVLEVHLPASSRSVPEALDPGQAPSLWLLAESHWAEEFLPPSFLGLCRWGLYTVPWTIASHLGKQIRRYWRSWWSHWRAGRHARGLAHFLHVLAILLVVPVAAGLGMVTILILLVLALLPIPWLRRWLGETQRLMAGTLGDSLVLLENPVQRAAIVDRVVRDLRWLAGKVKNVAVVAHSQGAAIAYQALATRVLADRDPSPECLFFTYGSGLSKLEELRWFRRQRPAWAGWVAPVGLLLVVTALFAGGWLGQGFADPDPILVGWLLITGSGLFMMGMAAAVQGMELDSSRVDPVSRFGLALRWCDRWASADPVSNGPLCESDQPPPQFKTREDFNLASLLFDHTSYHRNPDGFLPALVRELAELAGRDLDLRPQDQARLALAWYRRRFRVQCLALARRLILGSAALVVVALVFSNRLVALGESLKARFGTELPTGQTLLSSWTGWADRLAPEAFVALIVVAAVGLAWLLVMAAWWWWDWTDIQTFFWRRNYELQRDFWLFAIVASFTICGVLAGVLAILQLHPSVGARVSLGPVHYFSAIFVMTFFTQFLAELVRLAGGRRRLTRNWRALRAAVAPRVGSDPFHDLLERLLVQALWLGNLTFLWTAPIGLTAAVVIHQLISETAAVRMLLSIGLCGTLVTWTAMRRCLPVLNIMAAIGPPEEALAALTELEARGGAGAPTLR